MDINELQRNFAADASALGDYQDMDKTTLANGYCDADEALIAAIIEDNKQEIHKQRKLKSAYFSALMLRYWYKIFEWAQNSSSLHLDFTEFADWLSHSLYVAFYYRMWRYEYEATVKHGKFIDWKYDEEGNRIPNKYYWRVDNSAPDKIINRCCASMRGRVYQFYNKDKRRTDVQTASIDQMVEDIGDGAAEHIGMAEDNLVDSARCLIEALIKREEFIEALIVDGIANSDTFKYKKNKDSGESAYTFDSHRLVKHLNSIDLKFIHQFCLNYMLKSREDEIFNLLKSMNNSKLYYRIKKTLAEIKQTPELLNCLL